MGIRHGDDQKPTLQDWNADKKAATEAERVAKMQKSFVERHTNKDKDGKDKPNEIT